MAKAVRFIAEHYQEPILTKDVAAETGISKRPLQDRFLRHIGRTIHEQITHKRIEHARQLLAITDIKTSHIALESGFGSRQRFSRTFKQITGMNPVDYRRAES